MSDDRRARLKRWLESGEASLHPLTFPQRELWEASPAPVADVSNHICALIHVRGAITAQDCVAALQRVVDRQEVLRLSFLPGKGQSVQLIRARSEPALRYRELSSSQATAESIEELAQGIFREPFDLLQGPLYRAEVLRRGVDDHVFVFTIHHAIADGWTLGVFVEDLCAAYLQDRMGVGGGLPAVPTSYTAWGAAEREFWEPPQLAQRATFWKSRLTGTRRLWTAHEAHEPASALPNRMVSYLPSELGRGVRELARRNGATLFSTLLAGFQIALSRWTGAEDILVGTPVANRNRQAVRETMGYFAGIVPLRGFVEPDRPFSGSIRAVHENIVDCLANAMPFAELVHALGEPASPGYNPIFQVRFALQNHPVPDVEVRGLSLKLRMRSTGTPRFDLGCEITENGDALEVVWLFRTNLFSQSDMQDLGELFRAVLASGCRLPESRTATVTT